MYVAILYGVGFLGEASGEIVAKSHVIPASGQLPPTDQCRFSSCYLSRTHQVPTTLTFPATTSAFEEKAADVQRIALNLRLRASE